MSLSEFDARLRSLDLPDKGDEVEASLRQGVFAASQTTPDAHAKTLQLSNQTGIPADIVSRNFEQITKRSTVDNFPYADLLQNAPSLARWLASSPDNVAVAHDDITQLTRLDKLLDIVKSFPGGAMEAIGMGESGSINLLGVLSRQMTRGVRAIPGVGPSLANILEIPIPRAIDPFGAVQRHGEAMQAYGQVLVPPERRNFATDVVGGLGQIAGQVGTSILGGEVASFLQLFGQGAAQMVQQAKAKGKSGAAVDNAILFGAGVTAITEKYGLSSLLERVPPNIRNGVLRYVADIAIAGGNEAAQEISEGVLQNIATQLAIDPDQKLLDGLSRQALTAGTSGAIARAFLQAFVPGRARVVNQVQEAKQNAPVLQALPQALRDSKTFQRLPEAVQAFLRNAVADSGKETVHVPVDAFQTYFQDKADPAAIAADVTGDPQAYSQAVETGGRLAIPLEKYAALAAGEGGEFLWKEAALGDGDAMSFNDAVEYEHQLDQQLEAEQQDILPPAETVTLETSAAKVREDIVGQLVGQGYSPEAIQAHAAFVQEAFKNFVGERAGLDPFAVYQKYGLEVIRPVPEVLAKLNTTGATDVLLDRLRNNDVPAKGEIFGVSLLDFLRSKGGVIDEGGELKSLEVDADHKPGRKNLIQKNGLPLDTAREAAAEAGYLPEGSTTADLLDKIETEVRGAPVYSSQAVNEQALETATVLEQLSSYLQAIDVDLEKTSNAEIKKRLVAAAEGPAGQSFEQTFGTGKRGRITFSKKQTFGIGKTRITLTDNANLSTLAHELGHLYLNLFESVAGDLAALKPETLSAKQQRILEDWSTLRAWLGAQEGAGISDPQHEQFARGVEAYLAEGNAPSLELRGVFSRFRQWILNAYRLFRKAAPADIGQALNVQLSDQVRGILDRMLASDDAIAEAERQAGVEAMFDDQVLREKVGMTPEQYKPYQKIAQDARDAARAKLDAQLAKENARVSEQWWTDRRAEVRTEVERDVHRQKEYVALAALRYGKHPDGTALPEGAFVGKLDVKSLEARYGKASKTPGKGSTVMNKLLELGVYRRQGGISADAAAEFFGYSSGEQLVEALVNARDMNQLIEAETDSRMRRQYGDALLDGTIVDKARVAVTGPDRSALLHEELKAINRKRQEVEKFVKAEQRSQQHGRREMLRSLPPVSVVRAWAVRVIAATKVGELRPGAHWTAMRKASKLAFDAVAKQDWSTAYAEKLRELRNSELYVASRAMRDSTQEALNGFEVLFKSDAKLGKFHDLDFVNAAKSIAATLLEYPQKKGEAETYLKKVQEYDPDVYETLSDQIQSVLGSGVTSYKDLTVTEFAAAADVVKGLYELASRTRQIEIDGKLLERQAAILELTQRVGQIAKPGAESLGYRKSVTKWEKTKIELLGIQSALRRVESWADAADGGNPDGPFRKFIWNPISSATAKYRIARNDALTRYLAIAKGVEASMVPGKIAAPELSQEPVGYTLRLGGFQSERPVGYTFESKAALLHAVLHSGNESNLQKLLRGYGWGDYGPDGVLDTSRWDGFLARMQATGVLTKADFDYVQATWDLLESLKPEAQRAHKKLYGFYFREIEPRPLETRFGVYKGGYVPAIADPFISPDAASRNEKQLLTETQNAAIFPSTGRGFTKTRVQNYTKPLALDLRYIPSHIDRVLRFSHIQPAVKDVGRIIFDRGFRQTLGILDPTVTSDMIVPWLQRAATQRVSQPEQGWGGKAVDRFFGALRRRTGLQLMALNVNNSLQQLTGLFVSAVKVKPRFLVPAMWTYMRSPRKTAAAIAEASEFMRTRETTQTFRTQKGIEEILLNPSKYEKIRDFAVQHAYVMSTVTQGIVDSISWSAAYDQAVHNGKSQTLAVRQADSVVRLTQGSFEAEDISKFSSSTPFVRAFSTFFEYFNMLANLNQTEFQVAVRDMGLGRGAARSLYVYSMSIMATAVVSEAILRALSGEGLDADRDDSYLDDILDIFIGSQFRTVTAMVPAAGSIAQSALNIWNGKVYDDRITVSPAVSALESATRAPYTAYKALKGEGSAKRGVRDVLTAVGLLSGLPAGAIAKPAGYLADVGSGEAEPEGPLDLARGLVSGRTPRR